MIGIRRFSNMFFPTLQTYIQGMLSRIPWTHWAAIGIISLAVFLSFRKKISGYAAVALGISTFIGLFLLDMSVLIRFCGYFPHSFGYDFKVDLNRIFHGNGISRVEVFSNFAVYVPLGFFLSEYMAVIKRFRPRSQFGLATLAAFGLSLCIELLQWALQVGFFELTDLVMNTFGGFVGAGVSVGWRKVSKATTDKMPG